MPYSSRAFENVANNASSHQHSSKAFPLNKRIHIVGRKNSGKTTLIVDLVKAFSARGLRVGTIKHTHHHHELDTPGKDSHRHRQAGAAMVGIMAPGMNALFWPQVDEESDRYDQMLAKFADCDFVLVEGHATGPGVKVEVWRAATETEPLAIGDESIMAVVSAESPEVNVPVWSRSDIAGLAERILTLAKNESA